MKEFRRQAEADHARKLRDFVGEDKKADERMITKAVHEHEDKMHGGKHTKLKFRDGGAVSSDDNKSAPARRDRGGAATKKGGKGPHVNVIVAPQVHPGLGSAPMPGMMAPPPAPPPRPPVPPAAAPMPGGAPGGMAGGPPVGALPRPPMPAGMPIRKRGGKVAYPLDDGAASGEGRLEKIAAYGAKSNSGEEKRRRGGRA